MLRVVVRLDVDSSVRCELRGIDENPRPDGMRFPRETVNGLEEAGHVRGAAHRDQPDALAIGGEQAVEVVLVESSLGGDAGSNYPGSSAPGKVVRVVLHRRREHHAPLRKREAEGELVDRFRRVLSKDDGVAAGVGADETRDGVVSFVIGDSAEARLESTPPVNARVVGKEAFDRVEDLPQGRRARGVVEIDVRRKPPIQEGKPLVKPHNSVSPGGHCGTSTLYERRNGREPAKRSPRSVRMSGFRPIPFVSTSAASGACA